MTDRPTSEVLDLAADVIEKYGWKQGIGWRPSHEGGACLEGGIAAAMGITIPLTPRSATDDGLQTLVACPAYKAVEDYLAGFMPADWFRIYRLYNWNDTRARDQQQVIEVLRAAAAVERAKEESLEGAEVTA